MFVWSFYGEREISSELIAQNTAAMPCNYMATFSGSSFERPEIRLKMLNIIRTNRIIIAAIHIIA